MGEMQNGGGVWGPKAVENGKVKSPGRSRGIRWRRKGEEPETDKYSSMVVTAHTNLCLNGEGDRQETC